MQTEKTQIQTGQDTSARKTEKTTSNLYDYRKVLVFLEKKGKEYYGAKFQLCQEDREIVKQLIAYFLQDGEVCSRYGISLEKGIMLTGPIGCGKTTLMNLMAYVSRPENRHIMKNTRDITFEFIKNGYDTINQYTREKPYSSQFQIYCFDDLGVENNIKYFGNDCNVMAEILLSRYDLYVSHKLRTHITTNLSATELEEAYGNRLRSRLREMVNLIAFDKSTKDKRK